MSGWRALTAVLLAAVCLGWGAAPAWAHANLVRSEPSANAVLDVAPERLQLWFTEPLESGFSEVQVLDANGRRVDLGDSRVAPDDALSMLVSLPPLEQGAYTVAWKALSQVDGHVTRGTYSLLVGVEAPPGPPPPPDEAAPYTPAEAAIRWLGYVAATALFGALLVRGLVLAPGARRLGLWGGLLGPARHGVLRVGLWSWGLLALTTLAALGLQVYVVGAGGEAGMQLGELLLQTRYGLVLLARVGLVALLGGVLLWLRSASPAMDEKMPGVWWLALGLGGGVLLTTSLNSHSAAVGGLTAVAIAADWLHQAAVAVWIGGLFGLALVLSPVLGSLSSGERWRYLSVLISRFSALALASVGVLIATGLYQVWLHVGSLGALVETLYGRSLLLKLALVAPLLALGAANKYVLGPRLARAVGEGPDPPVPFPRWEGGGEGDAGTQRRPASVSPARLAGRFSRTVRAEAVLGVLVLLATGVLTSIAPARQTYEQIQASQPLVMSGQAQDVRLMLSISPARPGLNSFSVLLHGPEGQPIDDAERVDLRFTYLDEDLGTSIETAEPEGEGRYVARGANVAVEGRWQVELLVRQAGQEDVRTAFRFLVTPTSAQEERAGGAAESQLRLPELGFITFAALGLVLAGVGLVVYVARTLGLRSLEGGALSVVSVVVIGLGIFLAFRAQPAGPVAPQDIKELRNPFPPNQESLAIGEQIYQAECAVCHGIAGRGDGPAAATLNPRPADLREHMAAGHTDGELFFWVSDGVQGTAMPAFRDQLSEEERWHVINYIRMFAAPGG